MLPSHSEYSSHSRPSFQRSFSAFIVILPIRTSFLFRCFFLGGSFTFDKNRHIVQLCLATHTHTHTPCKLLSTNSTVVSRHDHFLSSVYYLTTSSNHGSVCHRLTRIENTDLARIFYVWTNSECRSNNIRWIFKFYFYLSAGQVELNIYLSSANFTRLGRADKSFHEPWYASVFNY